MALILFALSFLFPLGLYPFQDTVRGLLAFSAVIFFFCSVFFSRKTDIYFPASIAIYLIFGFLWLLSFSQYAGSILISYNIYLFAVIFCLAIAFALPTYLGRLGEVDGPAMLAKIILALGVAALTLGLLRYYGVLKHVFPIINEDGDRLLGPMGQPNLMGLLMAMSLSALIFLRLSERLSSSAKFWVLVVFIGCGGYLTGSRSFIISEVIVLSVYVFYCANRSGFHSWAYGMRSFLTLLVVLVAVGVFTPVVDKVISSPLIESGFVNRVDADAMYQSRASISDSGRLAEWRKVFEYPDLIQNIWLGNGIGSYGEFSNEAALLQDNVKGNGKIWNHPHNIFVIFFVEFGVAGVLFISLSLLYLLRLVYFNRADLAKSFLSTVVLIFVFHSLVEFSLWYFPYLALFVASLTLLDKELKVTVSTPLVGKFISCSVLVVFLGISSYVWRDVYSVLGVMYGENQSNSSLHTLNDVSRSSVVGDGAISVLIFKFAPGETNLERQLQQAEAYATWRPAPLYMLRYATLTAAVGKSDKACSLIERSVFLYPTAVDAVQRELKYLSEIGKVSTDYTSCVLRGVDHWVR